jgi:type IV secretion system protein VirB4
MKDKIKDFLKIKTSVFELEAISPDFIPYACHYDERTLLTKNGELMQTIRIIGLSQEQIGGVIDLREIIRKSILDNIHSQNFAIWIHTIRKKTNLDPPAVFKSEFAKDVHDSWCIKNYWNDKYVNELYITILYQSEPLQLKSFSDFKDSLFLSKQKNIQLEKLRVSSDNLQNVVDNMLNTLSSYGARRLEVQFDEDGARSELLEFISKLIHLHEKRQNVPIADISDCLSKAKIAFGSNIFQISDKYDYFGAMFSIKEYHDFSSKLIDNFLRLPQEAIVTQTLTFVDSAVAKKSFKSLEKILKVSKDPNLAEWSGLQKILNSDKGGKTDFSEQSLTIMFFSDSQDELQYALERMYKEISKLGIIFIREDLNCEALYWSQLPGNFNFVNRTSYIATSDIAGFASLHNSPAGRTSSIWGAPITLFRKEDGAPYYFNFHDQKVGHTLIVGPQNSYAVTLMNFLICESSKIDPKIFVIGDEKSKILVKALNGDYKKIIPDINNQLPFNPLLLSDNEKNRKFLLYWFRLLISENYQNSTEDDNEINSFIKEIFNLNQEDRYLSKALSLINNNLKDKLKDWYGSGQYASIFDNPIDYQSLSNNLICFDISEIISNKKLCTPIVLYLINRFNNELQGTPSIIAFNETAALLNNQFFAQYIPDWLDYLTNSNAIAINYLDSNNNNINYLEKYLPYKYATILNIADQHNTDFYINKLKYNNQETKKINTMNPLYRILMIKQHQQTTFAELNLAGIDYAIKALTGNKDTIQIFDKIVAENGDSPNHWLHPFYKKII